jgi:type I restriction enzyme S subunit
VTAFRDGAVTLRANRRMTGFTEALQEIGYQGIRKGDLVIHAMDAFAGAIGVSDSDGKGTPVYSVCQPTGDANSWYFALVLREMSRSGYLLSLAKGIRERSTDFRFADFASLMVPLPPIEEQEQIVRFVRHLDSKVNRLIKAKRRLIELLNEQKQAIIHQAVTRGLDPTVPLKPSGIGWLGNVPEHWVVKPLKRWARMNAKTLTDKTPDDFEFRYLDIGSVGTGRLAREPDRMRFAVAPSRARRVVRSGDTVISTVRTYLKAMYFVETVEEPVIASTGFAVLSPTAAIVPRYLFYLIQSADFINRVTANSIGIAYPAISESRMGSFHLAAPEVAEQLEILAFLDIATAPFDNALSRAQAEIDLIREYRTRLVADVVTGQLDVRHLDLPDVEEQLEALSEDSELDSELEETDNLLEETEV